MSLKSYPEYKDSGVERIGQVPVGWRIGRLKDSVKTARNGVWGSDPTGGDLDLRCVRVADFDRPHLSIHNRNTTKRSVSLSDREGRLLTKGDLLLEKSGGGEKSPVGFVVLVDIGEPAVCSNFVARVTLNEGMDSRYWNYVHSSNYSIRLTQRSIKQATGIQNLDQSSYFNETVAYPNISVQEQIADFLDRETAEIDAFIADQEELIALLNERRSATITQAVTKGLDPNAPMKDSGLKWIRQVPESWGVERLSWLFETISSGTTPAGESNGYYDGDINWVTTGELREALVFETKRKVTSHAVDSLSALRVYDPGTLLIAMYGATIGRLGILGEKATTNQACCAFAGPRPSVLQKFVFFALMSSKTHLLVIADGGGQPNINQDKLRSLRIALPPLHDQEKIVEYLERETSEIDATIADAHGSIALSKERRAALISAAVTGKIDVRDAITSKQQSLEGELVVH